MCITIVPEQHGSLLEQQRTRAWVGYDEVRLRHGRSLRRGEPRVLPQARTRSSTAVQSLRILRAKTSSIGLFCSPRTFTCLSSNSRDFGRTVYKSPGQHLACICTTDDLRHAFANETAAYFGPTGGLASLRTPLTAALTVSRSCYPRASTSLMSWGNPSLKFRAER